MNYFITESERRATDYHEWAKGQFDGVSFWQPDSLLISEDTHYRLGLEKLFRQAIPDYDPLGEFTVTPAQWEIIRQAAEDCGSEILACIREAEEWVRETFETHGVFTMIGV